MVDLNSTKSLLIDRILKRMEEHGVGRFEYQLYDFVDMDTVVDMVNRGDADRCITLYIHGLEVKIHGTGDVDVNPR